jgi:FMN phosphatase YigB (HAD superfamily)
MGTRLTEPIQALVRTRHLLVDLDGTLLSARDLPLTIDFITQVIRAFRPHFPWYRTIQTLRALNADLHRPAPEGLRDLTNDRRAAHILAAQVGVTVEAAERILRETIPVIFPSLKRHFYPRRNALEFLAWARETYGPANLTLATNPVWPEDLVRLRMEWAGIDPGLFGWISHAGVMHACKPTQEYYVEVLRLRGLESADCALVGNDLKMDVPATRLGIPVFIVSDDPRLVRLPVEKGAAPAWRGDFAAIRRALETARRPRGPDS